MELQLALNLDAIFALCFLLATVKSLGISFEEFAARLPSTSIKRQEVFCTWNSKGKVIRELINHKDAIKECIEGVMFAPPNGRVIILPDGERPVCNIISEAANAEFAEELSAVYEEKVKRISKS
jgi:mannose-1-phosphate guanylyltransferase/phosphomannomutase